MPGARILLIEDDAVLRDLVSRNLKARHHEVYPAEDAQGALALLRTRCFDLILLDVNLPDRTGWDILRTAQHEGYFCNPEGNQEETKLPVVILSAVRVSVQRLAEFHPLAYLPKPFPMEALLRLAVEAAERRAAQEQPCSNDQRDSKGQISPMKEKTTDSYNTA